MKTQQFADKKLIIAMGSYVLLAIIGVSTLDGILLGAVLCLLTILAVKTLIHARNDEKFPD